MRGVGVARLPVCYTCFAASLHAAGGLRRCTRHTPKKAKRLELIVAEREGCAPKAGVNRPPTTAWLFESQLAPLTKQQITCVAQKFQ